MLLFGLYVMSGITGVVSQTPEDAKILRYELMVTDGYDKNILPLNDQSKAVDVYVNFNLLSINDLHGVTETLKTTGYLSVVWYDEFLVWDPDMYGGIYYVHWPQNDIWKPDLTLRNSVLDYRVLGEPNLKVQVSSDGMVNWYPFQVFQSSCSVDITHYPFDVQTCDLTFAVWSYSYHEVSLKGGALGIQLEDYQESSLWEIVETSGYLNNASVDVIIKFTIKMKRKPLYFINAVILPIVMLAILNVFVFILPCESGERAGYAITVFLALAVFLTIVAQSLPTNSDNLAIITIYVLIQTLQSTVITLLALWTIRMSTKETLVPKYLVKLTDFIHCLQCQRPKRHIQVAPYRTNGSDRDYSAEPQRGTTPADPKNSDEIASRNITDGQTEMGSIPNEAVTWSVAVRAVDFVLTVFFVTNLIVTTFVCLILASATG